MPTSQHKPFTTIVGLSNQARIPRLGRIRLGHTNFNPGNGKKHGVEDPFFQVPQEVQDVYGPTPTELDILLPANDRTIVFPQALEYYGSSTRPLCTGNGQEARRWNQEKLTYQPCACPCPLYGNGCSERGHLMVILPKVKNHGGVYQIDTGSKNAIQGINSALNLIAPEGNPDDGILGFIAMVPMKLKRMPRHIYPDGKHKITYPISLSLAASHDEIEELRQQKTQILAKTKLWIVEEPDRFNPEQDPDVIVTMDEEPALLNVSIHSEHDRQVATQADPSIPISTTTGESTVPEASVSNQAIPRMETNESPTTSSAVELTPQLPADSNPKQNKKSQLPVSEKPHTTQRETGGITTLSGAITQAQLIRILTETGKVQIPADIVRNVTSGMTKKEASSLITQLIQHNYSAFESHLNLQVPLR